MQLQHLLLAVYASVALGKGYRTTPFTYYLDPTYTGWPGDVQQRINDAMNTSTNFYTQHAPNVDGIMIHADYDSSIETDRIYPALQEILFGPDSSYQNWFWALTDISHILGVGTPEGSQNAWSDWCGRQEQSVLDSPTATRLLQSWNLGYEEISCDLFGFEPFGLNYPDEFNEDSAMRHVQLVQAMVRDGLENYGNGPNGVKSSNLKTSKISGNIKTSKFMVNPSKNAVNKLAKISSNNKKVNKVASNKVPKINNVASNKIAKHHG